jgi:hypothetical protein
VRRSPKNIYRILGEVARYGAAAPATADADHVLCHLFERIARGDERLLTIGPEILHLRDRRPDDTKFAWERMGDPVRCMTSEGNEITLWPWWDLERHRERVELHVAHMRDGRAFRVPARIRGHYRDRIATGFFQPHRR